MSTLSTARKMHSFKKISMMLLLLLLSFALLKISPEITGFIIKEHSYTEKPSLVVTASAKYELVLPEKGELLSLKVDGSISKGGSGKIYLENNGARILVFDSSRMSEAQQAGVDSERVLGSTLSKITGFAVDEAENQTATNETLPINQTNETAINETNEAITNETIKKTISISMEYGNNEFYDANNDGIEELNGVIDFTIQQSSFSWDADHSKV